MAGDVRPALSVRTRWAIWATATAIWIGACALVAAVWNPSQPPSVTAPGYAMKTADASSTAAASEASATEPESFVAARAEMVEQQLRGRDITDPRVLEAMGRVPRQRFVPDETQPLAYADRPLPIGQGQTISQPYVVALMTQLARPTPPSRALEIGTGSGYQAAVLAETCREVYSVEIIESLANSAERLLAELGYTNVSVSWGDGYRGWPERAPFDVILVTAAADHVPPALVEQLAVGGRLVIPVGSLFQELMVLERQADGRVVRRMVAPVAFVPMTGEVQDAK